MEIIREGTTPNMKPGTGRAKIAIVDHQTAGRFPGCLSWMMNPDAKASAHYLVTRTGLIYQLADDEDITYHAGAVANPTWPLYDGTNPNKYTIGIEHECYPEVGGDGNLTDEQYQATLWLHQQLIAKHDIPIDRDHIIGHYEIDSVNRAGCPGDAFPWARLMLDLLSSQTDNLAFNAAIDKLMAKGIITSGDYWKKAVASNTPVRGDWMAVVIQRMTRKSDLNSAVSALAAAGVVGQPDYWLQNCQPGKTIQAANAKIVVANAVNKLGL